MLYLVHTYPSSDRVSEIASSDSVFSNILRLMLILLVWSVIIEETSSDMGVHAVSINGVGLYYGSIPKLSFNLLSP